MKFKFLKAAFVLAAFFMVEPTFAKAQVIGEYGNGCIKGAVPLQSGSYYQVQQWSGGGRNYGHPQLIDYLKTLIKKAHQEHLPNLLIGDLSKPYGGSFGSKSSHGSHQSGLDVDISFDFATPRKTAYELSHPKDVYIVTTKGEITSNFDENRVKLIYLAASDPRVERIFVSPGIKRYLCKLYENQDRAWLSKLRPWFGHRGHMHVRLSCPLDSPLCVAQKQPPKGDGCGYEVESWFMPPVKAKNTKKPKKVKKVLPKQCQELFLAHY
ncbi:MAG: penicillin-insensitive murein endopeptidase [Succinivibrio sp.]|nr:penicillin-insensitive murein endopeptidase [Succinivibrio sp.]MCI5576221.1 penicillin-insensitive murein endopeptidase [Succinivibrio sp.]MCI6450535.1 penicillin-insensitive murein endopeptidase [Succinivibrio sp.]MCI7785613.1 penicillin-insensitive murein endopeptidase [Succinivibrio sp.]MDY5904083.1 penicillin-insensitive murein endopeptidase [Succinivibrio sp.]